MINNTLIINTLIILMLMKFIINSNKFHVSYKETNITNMIKIFDIANFFYYNIKKKLAKQHIHLVC